MKLSYEDKVQIYELRKQGQSFKQLSNKFVVRIFTLMFSLIDKVLLEDCSQRSVPLDYTLPNSGLLLNLLAMLIRFLSSVPR